MKQQHLALFLFVDAFGWEILQRHPNFLADLAPHRKKLDTIFGYSSACDPSIISGRLPQDHLMWSSFYYSPDTCPYPWIKNLKWLPKKVTDYHRVRHKLSRLIARSCGFTGYFQLYNLPFQKLPYFDYAEKNWMWGKRDGLLNGPSIFDKMLDTHTPFYVKPTVTTTDEEQNQAVWNLIAKNEIAYSFLFLGKLDALMHSLGNSHPQVTALIQDYEKQIRNLISHAKKHYETVSFYVFSDHGMHNVTGHIDLQKQIESLCLSYGKDYIALYDSTMARFWFLNPQAKEKIHSLLQNTPEGAIVSPEKLQQYGTYFPDNRYGETIFLLNPGLLIAPSYMGIKPIPGMHGYDPNDPDSAAMICSNQPLPSSLQRIEQIYGLMTSELNI